MKSTSFSLLAAAALALPWLSTAHATTYTLLHRISSFEHTPEWSVRGRFELPSPLPAVVANATVEPAVAVTSALSDDDVVELRRRAAAEDAVDLWYQLALSPASDTAGEVLETSVRLCHLRQSSALLPTLDDELLLTLRPHNPNPAITSFAYRVRDITLDATHCPSASPQKLARVQADQKKQRQRQLARRSRSTLKTAPVEQPKMPALHTKVSLKHTQTLARKTLKQALPTNEDGTVQTPPPEKSFLQKYWMYMIPIAILLLMPPGDDDRAKGAEAHASSEHAGTGMGAKHIK